jgi:hypothetical protein
MLICRHRPKNINKEIKMPTLTSPELSPQDKLGPDSGVKPGSEYEQLLLAQHRNERLRSAEWNQAAKSPLVVEHLGTVASQALTNPAESIPTQDLREVDTQAHGGAKPEEQAH